MRIHANVLLSISSHCAQSGECEPIALSLFGTRGLATECLRLNIDDESWDSQISEHHELFRAVSPDIEYCGIVLVNAGLDPSQLSHRLSTLSRRSPRTRLLLVDLNDETTGAQAFELDNDNWHKTEIQMERDPASGIAINDALVASGAQDVMRAKVLLRDKIRYLQTELDGPRAGEVIKKYGQLKKMHMFRAKPESARSREENLELIAQIIAKSDKKHTLSSLS